MHSAPDTLATLTIDGSCDHITRRAGAAAVLKLPDGTTASATESITTSKSSEAELHALEIGLQLAAKRHVTHLIVYGDNEGVTEAINGRARFPKPRAGRIHELLTRFREVTAVHVSRDENNADLYARLARPDDRNGRSRRAPRNPHRRGRDYHRNRRRHRTNKQYDA